MRVCNPRTDLFSQERMYGQRNVCLGNFSEPSSRPLFPSFLPGVKFSLWATCIHRNIILSVESFLLRLHGALGTNVNLLDWAAHITSHCLESEPQSTPAGVSCKGNQTACFIRASFHTVAETYWESMEYHGLSLCWPASCHTEQGAYYG